MLTITQAPWALFACLSMSLEACSSAAPGPLPETAPSASLPVVQPTPDSASDRADAGIGEVLPVAPIGDGPEHREDARYPLDSLSRKAPLRGRLYCPRVEMVRYQGEVVRFQKPLDVYVGFVDHLRRFEAIVRDTAIEIYGRAPAKIWHYGPNRCRRIRQWPFLISEHSLGNAIDVGGFEFARVQDASEDVPRQLRAGFTVNLSLHWTPRRKRDEIHSRFLRTLARRMIESEGLFSTILGPADRNHKGHFHLDMAARDNVIVFGPRK